MATAKLTFEEHDGALVPVLRGGDEVASLVSVLQSSGLEVLFPEPGTYILYTKEYKEEEQRTRDKGQGFHRGYSIATLFNHHPVLRGYVDAGSLAATSPFLDEATLAAVTRPSSEHARWENHWTKDVPPPWESGMPYGILSKALDSDGELQALLARAGSGEAVEAIDLGCGGGQNTVYLAEKGLCVVGVDIVAAALALCESLAKSKGPAIAERLSFAKLDVFKLLEEPAEQLPGGRTFKSRFDLICDFQCFHVLRSLGEDRLVEVLAGLLKPGGLLFLITGNADEAQDRGPVRLRRDELEKAFAGSGLEFLWLRPDRMDDTAVYAKNGTEPPLAWACLLRKIPV